MALELPHDRLDTASPVSSGGRDSPAPGLWRGEEEDYSRDKGFRRYASAIDRALSIFDTQLQEWADYISFLGRLLKALQSHPSNINVVPSKSLVARRLAQCLAPSLPSGVHQKAIEVYSYIFTLISPSGVARDLSLYLPGLSPVLSFASLTVRSPFLTLLRQHILPLPAHILRPACKALILTLLPGLEDEGSEDFDTTYKLLNDFRNALRPGEDSEDGYFWQCFFLATITSPSRRLGSMAYLVRELPKLGSGTSGTNDVPEEEAKFSAKMLTTPEPGLLVRCFAAGLRDEQILIQRGFLDLLVTHLPLHASVFKSTISTSDLELLMTAASSVVARRDMSLNRRLWSWLLGPEPLSHPDDRPTSSGTDKGNASSKTEYFENYGSKPLSSSILALINADPKEASERAKPFRICLSLMDRWEIGGLVVPLVFLPAMRSVKRYQSEEGVEKKDFQEVLRGASVFFNGVESGLIWSEINSLIFTALANNTIEVEMSEEEASQKKLEDAKKMESLELVRFIITHFNIREEEMLTIHIPLTTLGILCSVIAELSDSKENYERPLPVNSLAVTLALELLSHIPPAVLTPRNHTSDGEKLALDDGSVLIRLQAFYTQHHGDASLSPPPLTPSAMTKLFLHKAITLFTQSLSVSYPRNVEPCEYSPSVESAVANYAALLLLVLEKTSSTSSLSGSASTIHSHANGEDITALYETCKKVLRDYNLPLATASAILDIILAPYPTALDYSQLYILIPPFVRQFWERMNARQVRNHVEAVRCIWKLHHALCGEAQEGAEREVEGCLSALMLDSKPKRTGQEGEDAVGAWGVLWLHSQGQEKDGRVFREMITRPLFLVLDLLANEDEKGTWAEFGDAKRWIQSLHGESLALLFKVLAEELALFPRFQEEFIGDWQADGKAVSSHDREPVDCEGVVYTMNTLGNILKYATAETWYVLGTFSFHLDHSRSSSGAPQDKGTFLSFFSNISLRGIGGLGIGTGDSTMRSSVPTLNRASLRLLGQLWSDDNNFASSKELREIIDDAAKVMCWWLEKLNQNMYMNDAALMAEILEVLDKTLRVQSQLGASAFEQQREVDVELYNRHLQNEIKAMLAHSQTQTKPQSLVWMLQRTIKRALLSRAAQGVMGQWTGLVKECVRLGLFQLEALAGLVNGVLHGLAEGMFMLREAFRERGERSLEGEFEDLTVEGEKSMGYRIDMLECLVMKAHEIVHVEDILMLEAKGRKSTTREERGSEKGFLGGIFGSTDAAAGEEKPKDTPITTRQRVQVLITNAVKYLFTVWHWADAGKKELALDAKHSFHYVSLKLRSRARKLLELLFQREPGPCMESMVTQWTSDDKDIEKAALQLVNVLDKTQPHNTMPLLFELVHDRVAGPTAGVMEWQKRKDRFGRKHITTTPDLLAFLNEYTLSLENDAIVECWNDTAAFLRDVLANPMTYRGILPALVKFLGLVGDKISKTSRGKTDKAMRREIADLWLRLLTAVFTTNPSAWQHDASTPTTPHPRHQAQDIVSVLAQIALSMPHILHDNTLILQAANTISSSIIQPTIRAKNFPENIRATFLSLFHAIGQLGAGQQNSASAGLMKVFKRDVWEAFNHPAFFDTTTKEFALGEFDVALKEVIARSNPGWAKILRIWCQKDRERIITELLSRIVAPTTAGIVFGVGATSARQEADARTKATLKRITALILADQKDAWVAALPSIYAKLVELLTATTTSSPSSATRSEVYVLIRALITKTSPIHLSFLWPSLNSELESCLSSCLPGGNSREAEREREVWDGAALVQGCKLLEGLLEVAPEEWQVGVWTFVKDGVDAIAGVGGEDGAVALMDRLSLELGGGGGGFGNNELGFGVEGMKREEVIVRLQPFFAGLARRQFESVLERPTKSGKMEERMWKQVVVDVFATDDKEEGKVE